METMRLDEARSFLGIRLNAWTSIAMLVLALVIFVVAARLNRSTCLVGDERYVADEPVKAPDGDAGADPEADEDAVSGAGVAAAGGSVLESDTSVDLESDTSSDSQADAETRR